MTKTQKTFCWLVLLAGVSLAAFAARVAYRNYNIIECWPKLSAEITRSRVIYASQYRKPRYFAEYHFRYQVSGAPYTTSASVESSDYRHAQELVAQHPAGSTETLRYNSENPAEIRLYAAYSPQFFKLPLILAGVSLAFMFVGGMPLWREALRPRVEQVTCPNCQRSMDKGRRQCPYCKEELVKY